MSNKESTSKKVYTKEARQRVYDKLAVALAEFKAGVKDKKFEKNLRRTSKLFAVDFLKSMKKQKTKTAKIPKKKAEYNNEGPVQKSA